MLFFVRIVIFYTLETLYSRGCLLNTQFGFKACTPFNGCFTIIFLISCIRYRKFSPSTTIYEKSCCSMKQPFLSTTNLTFPHFIIGGIINMEPTSFLPFASAKCKYSMNSLYWRAFPHYIIGDGIDSHKYFQLHPLQIVSPTTIYEGT